MHSGTDDRPPVDSWITPATAAIALDMSPRRVREVAAAENWRTRPSPEPAPTRGPRPLEYAFADVVRTHQHRDRTTRKDT